VKDAGDEKPDGRQKAERIRANLPPWKSLHQALQTALLYPPNVYFRLQGDEKAGAKFFGVWTSRSNNITK